MTKSKTHIRLIKHLGIVLIALPEFVTTPLGVALVLLARYLSRKLESSLNRRLRESLTYYLAHFRRFDDGANVKAAVPASVRHYSQAEEQPVSWRYRNTRGFEAKFSPSVQRGSLSSRDNTVYHAIDMEWLTRRYGMRDGVRVEPKDSYFEVTPGRTEKLMPHSINREQLPRRYGSGGVALD
jgi:hypothetical protein